MKVREVRTLTLDEFPNLVWMETVTDEVLPTKCCFDGNVLWVTDFALGRREKITTGRLWRIETDARASHFNTEA